MEYNNESDVKKPISWLFKSCLPHTYTHTYTRVRDIIVKAHDFCSKFQNDDFYTYK